MGFVRALLVTVTCAIFLCCTTGAVAQALKGGDGQPTREVASKDRLLQAVARSDPDSARDIENKLRSLTVGISQIGLRANPTNEEAEEIAANPTFRLAYEHYPTATLNLLRRANKIVISSH